jgi:hypothetical protein
MSSQPRPFLAGKKREWDENEEESGVVEKLRLWEGIFLFLHASRTLNVIALVSPFDVSL